MLAQLFPSTLEKKSVMYKLSQSSNKIDYFTTSIIYEVISGETEDIPDFNGKSLSALIPVFLHKEMDRQWIIEIYAIREKLISQS